MKILLVNPYVEQMHLELDYVDNFRPPLGLGYVAAAAERAGHQVEVLDGLLLRVEAERFKRILRDRRPDLVGISTYSPTRYECFRHAHMVKEVLPSAVVVCGGPHASAVPGDTLREVPEVDYVVRGEGEETFPELLHALDTGGDPSAVHSVSCRVDGQPYDAPDRPNIGALDAIPFPARHLLPTQKYRLRMPSTMLRSTTMLTSRGCPARCTFCTRDWLSRDTRFHSCERIIAELDELIHRYGFSSFIFQDDTFTLNKRRIFDMCAEIRRRAWKIQWLATTRVDCVTPELLAEMKSAGCKVVTFGVESANAETLKWLKKGFTFEKAKRAIDWARAAGLTVRCSYLVGIGHETEEDIRNSLAAARALDVDRMKANVGLSVYPGTPLYQMAIDAGVLPAAYSYARGYLDPERRYGNGETPRWYTDQVPLERVLQLRRETDVNVLFTRPTVKTYMHRARKFMTRFRRHPVRSALHVMQFAKAFAGGSGLRPPVPDFETSH